MWIQLGRESLQRALSMAESFIEKTRNNPEGPWYLPMRLQRDQLCENLGRGRETLSELKAGFAAKPDQTALLRYISMLGHRQEYETALDMVRDGGLVKGLIGGMIFPPAKGNLPVWYELILAAAKTRDTGFIEQYLPPVLEVCGKDDELHMLMCLLGVYDGERLRAIKERLLSLLPDAGLDPYFENKAREKINLS